MTKEPAILIASIMTIIGALLAAFGIPLTEAETDGIVQHSTGVTVGVIALVSIVQGIWTRAKVSPAGKKSGAGLSLLVLLIALALPGCGTFDRPPPGEPDPVDAAWNQAQQLCDAWLARQRKVNPAEVVDFACSGQAALRPFYQDVLELFRSADARAEARKLERE